MSILGVGIDVVDFSRFEQTLERTPNLINRIFTPKEAILKLPSLAARFAAKEALAKALDAKDSFNWQEVEISNEQSGKPIMVFTGKMFERMAKYKVNVSLSHDAGIASAIVILESNSNSASNSGLPQTSDSNLGDTYNSPRTNSPRTNSPRILNDNQTASLNETNDEQVINELRD